MFSHTLCIRIKKRKTLIKHVQQLKRLPTYNLNYFPMILSIKILQIITTFPSMNTY